MDTREALRQLGATDDLLTAEERSQLDDRGFVVFEGLLDGGQLKRLRGRIDALVAEEGDDMGREIPDNRQPGTDQVSDLVNKGEEFDILYTHPRVLAAVAHVLGDELMLNTIDLRAPHLGRGHQALHIDAPAVTDAVYHLCSAAWLLDDVTEENGPTRIVPGSHSSGQDPRNAMDDPEAPHPDQLLLCAAAGSAVVFNLHLWHGGTVNRSQRSRRVILSAYSRRDSPSWYRLAHFMRPETRDRLSDAALHVLYEERPIAPDCIAAVERLEAAGTSAAG